MPQVVLEVLNLEKRFKSFEALRGISFSLHRGQTLGLLGPNGAGKTTTIHILLGITLADGGVVRYFGRDFREHVEQSLDRINFASAYNTLLGRITVRENLLVFANLYRIKQPRKKIDELVDMLEGRHLLERRYWDLSSGERTKIILVKSLLNDPEILLMDEPTASLDPDVADKTLSLIETIRYQQNVSILFTSHNMSEVTRICDEVLILDRGAVVARGAPKELSRRLDSAELELHIERSNALKLREVLDEAKLQYIFDSDCTVRVKSSEEQFAQIIVALQTAGVSIRSLDVHHPTLEDVFISIARRSK